MAKTTPAVDDRPVDTRTLAAILTEGGHPIAASTLNKYRCAGGGPPYLKFKRAVRYRPSQAMAWAAAGTREMTSTSDDRAVV